MSWLGMDFQRRKLYLAVSILIIGMAVALAWHGWQGWVLGKSYPYNTFLFLPKVRFSDLIEVLKCANSPSPYLQGSYFPATYPAFRPFLCLPPALTVLLFISVTSLGLWALALATTCSLVFDPARLLPSGLLVLATSVALTFSYPLLIGVDRGNIELLMALFVAIALLCFRYGRHRLGLLALFPCICFKFYPVLLLILFLRPRHLLQFLVVLFAFVLASVWSLATFEPTIQTSLQFWKQNVQQMNMTYVIHFWGASGTASPWNALRSLIGTCCYLISSLRPGETLVLRDNFLHPLFSLYSYLTMAASAFIVLSTVLVEREFFRRAVLLLLLLTLILPSGGDYRLIYANIALVVVILLPGKRRQDLLVVALLALVIVPKREIFLPFLGKSDSTFYDIPLAVLFNAPCLLVVLALLLSDTWKASSWPYARQRLSGLLRYVFSWKGRHPVGTH